MSLKQSKYAIGALAVAHPPVAGLVVTQIFSHTFDANLSANDILEMAPLLPGCVPTDAIVIAPDLDSDGSPAIALDIGVMSGTWGDNDGARTCGDELFDGITTAQAGGLARTAEVDAFNITPSDTTRSIGIKIATGAATAAFAGKTIKLVLSQVAV